MIIFDRVSVRYEAAGAPVLRDVNLTVAEGELCLVVGRTGCGKSTLLRAVNGLVPHFTGGTLSGRVLVDGRDTARHPPRALADVVGVVGQDPLAGFVTDTVEDELAYGMEQLGIAAPVMRTRVEETLDLLGLADVRSRSLREISGGQQQRVAIGAALTSHPKVLVLDEPTSALDPTAAEEVLAALARLVHDLAVTVVVAEHRLERVVQYADSVVQIRHDGTVTSGLPAAMFETAPVAPPVVRLGRLARWHPLPMSIRDARRQAAPLRERLTSAAAATAGAGPLPTASPADARPATVRVRGLLVRYGLTVALRGVDLDLRAGEVVAIMGRNGSGKSSLLWALQGSGPRQAGTVTVAGTDPRTAPPAAVGRLVGLVPQTPADLLYRQTVDAELATADAAGGLAPDERVPNARDLLDDLAPGIPGGRHPRDLSEGQRLALVLALQLRPRPAAVLLDEPTRGLDYGAKDALVTAARRLAAEGRVVAIATHDVEFVARAADRVLVLAAGEIVADGPTADVVVASPAFAPQVAKILAPLPLLTVEDVAQLLETRPVRQVRSA